jgi:hypothetical protein
MSPDQAAARLRALPDNDHPFSCMCQERCMREVALVARSVGQPAPNPAFRWNEKVLAEVMKRHA